LGQKYEHYEGGVYEFVLVATLTEDPNREVVVYRHLYPNLPRAWARPIDEFYGYVQVPNPVILGGKPLLVPRFREITDDEYDELRRVKP
jgi:hypothetical protein